MPLSECLLVLAPRGRDAQVIVTVLERNAMQGLVCDDVSTLRARLDEDLGGIIVTEEALVGPDIESLLGWCDAQAPWSDLPVIVLATRQAGQRSAIAARVLERLGNVSLVERPVNAETLASASRAALRARRRQYQARTLILEREQNERELRLLNDTLERRVEERARERDKANEVLAFALDSAGMGSWDLDLAHDSSRRTEQHDRIFGYEQPLPNWGRDAFLDHVIADDMDVAHRAFDEAERTGLLDVECRIRRSDGAVRWIAVKGKINHDPVGRPSRMAGIVMDVTERRATEDALRQAQKMEAIGQLTGGVAHDFNNLLTVVVGGLELIGRRPDNTERVVRLADAALTAAKRGEQLTKQLLAFSRRQTLRPQTLDPNRLLGECEGLARRAVGEAVEFSLDLDPGTAPIRIDAAQFESAVLNLIVNARDAMPEGGRLVVASRNAILPATNGTAASKAATGKATTGATATAGLVTDLPPGDYVVITVTDTGTGIDPDTLAHAFEPFFTTKDVGKGSGLGLSQVYGFTRGAGGDVVIDTTPGRGTTVALYFPRSNEPLAQPEVETPEEVPDPDAAGRTVLLVEDDDQVLAMALESLRELRYQVVVARNAGEALHHIRAGGPIDLMFSDVVMPGGMNGAQLAAEARKLRPDLRVLLTSGYAGGVAATRSVAETYPLLPKPYRRSDLANKLRTVMTGST